MSKAQPSPREETKRAPATPPPIPENVRSTPAQRSEKVTRKIVLVHSKPGVSPSR